MVTVGGVVDQQITDADIEPFAKNLLDNGLVVKPRKRTIYI